MKDIDKLIEAVFEGHDGALDGLDAESRREVSTLNTLKADLKLLRDVPECQLTTEHLKQAVLNQKPQRSTGVKGLWLWSPLALAAGVAVVFFMAKSPNTLNAPLAREDKPAITIVAPTPGSDASTDNNSDSPVAVAPRDVTPGDDDYAYIVEPPARVTSKPVYRAKRKRNDGAVRDTQPAASRSVEQLDGKLAASSSAPRFDGGGSKAATEADVTVAMKDSSNVPKTAEPVVVVTERPNADTGLAEAEEISRPSDVVFGG